MNIFLTLKSFLVAYLTSNSMIPCDPIEIYQNGIPGIFETPMHGVRHLSKQPKLALH